MKQVNAILKCKCPNCGEGDVFNTRGNIFLLKMPQMNESCKCCNYKFERETGFFFGAMYVSYSIAAAEMIAVLLLGWYFVGLSPMAVFVIIAVMVVLTSTVNFRLSRMIWMYLFFKKET